jgi:hypothetical protein
MKMIILTGGKGGRCHVMDDELPHTGGLPVCSELLQVLVDGVNGLIQLVHAVLEMTSAPLDKAAGTTCRLRQCEGMPVQMS